MQTFRVEENPAEELDWKKIMHWKLFTPHPLISKGPPININNQGSHIGVPRQRNGGHIGVPKQRNGGNVKAAILVFQTRETKGHGGVSNESSNSILCKRRVLF